MFTYTRSRRGAQVYDQEQEDTTDAKTLADNYIISIVYQNDSDRSISIVELDNDH